MITFFEADTDYRRMLYIKRYIFQKISFITYFLSVAVNTFPTFQINAKRGIIIIPLFQ